MSSDPVRDPSASPEGGEQGAFLTVSGDAVSFLLDALLTCRVANLREGERTAGLMADAKGEVIDTVGLRPVSRGRSANGRRSEEFLVFTRRPEVLEERARALARGTGGLDPEAGQIRVPSKLEFERGAADDEIRLEAASLDSPAAPHLVDAEKPFFLGQGALYETFAGDALPAWEPPEIERGKPLPKSILGAEHERLGVSRWGPFGSCQMPIQYGKGRGAIADEHRATREAAGLYDVSHMIPVIVKGPDARAFLELALGNSVARLPAGRGKYTCLSLPSGAPQDDLYVYCLEAGRKEVFLVVSNSGHESDLYYLEAVAEGKFQIDPEMPLKRFEGEVEFVTKLNEAGSGEKWSEALFSVALQGPKSREILLAAADEADRERLGALEFNRLATGVRLADADNAVVTFTGYTGEPVGYEIYTRAGDLPGVWRVLLAGGATAAGLGARDSTRQEAGLPLFGQEIGGPRDIPFSGLGYRRLVDFRKPFFLGRAGAAERERARTQRVFLLEGQTPRKVSHDWPVYDEEGNLLGQTTSTSTIRPGKTDCVQAYLEESKVRPSQRLLIPPPRRAPKPGEKPKGRPFIVGE